MRGGEMCRVFSSSEEAREFSEELLIYSSSISPMGSIILESLCMRRDTVGSYLEFPFDLRLV
jgi:hypothetical protein